MAITYNLPIKQWYFDTTSQWTLDYPPLFAAFEFLLALFAHLLNLQEVLNLTESSIRSESVIVYQKVTVILSDIIYYVSIYKLCIALEPFIQKINQKKKNYESEKEAPTNLIVEKHLLDTFCRPDTASRIALLLLLQPGLLLVDHIHFQYNGLLSGIFILSLASILKGDYASGSFWFALLLNFKHIYLYCAPAYGMYLLTSYCLAKETSQARLFTFLKRFLKLSLVVVSVFLIVYLPFADKSTLTQIVKRLFPFKRGLTHAYWAPNIWALYNTADKILATIFKSSLKVKFDLDSISGVKPVSSTSGLVLEYEHQYLPSVRPLTTFVLVVTFTLPLIFKFLLNIGRRSPELFLHSVTLAAFTSFLFGWHVHEKAIIVVLLTMIPLALINPTLIPTFLRLTLAGTYSLFPLLYQPAEYLTKLTLLIAYYSYAKSLCQKEKERQLEERGFFGSVWCNLYSLLDKLFVIFLIMIEIYITLIHGRMNYSWNPFIGLNKYQFLPLMLNSSFCALGITLSYLELYYEFVRPTEEVVG